MKHLITTEDERSWKYDRPVLFLGEWCRPYGRSASWIEMNAEVAEPFRLKDEEKSDYIEYVQALSSKLLSEVTDALNSFHNKNYSSRYWNILLGHWLQRHVDVCFNRYYTIDKVLKSYKIVSTTILEPEGYSLATVDSMSFMAACSNSIWNNVLYARVIKHMDRKDIDLELVPIKNEGFFKGNQNSAIARGWGLVNFAKAIIQNILPKLSFKHDMFIMNSGLPRYQEIKLQIALRQCPQFWQSPPLKTVPVDFRERAKFVINSDSYTGFERFVRDLLSEMIPTCFLEGYQQLSKQAEDLLWPIKPKFIFTSNNYDTNEVFKVWAGAKVESGVPYFIGQHGNNFGTMIGVSTQAEQVFVDKFFTWGWDNGNIKNVPSFIFKNINQKTEIDTHLGGLLLVQMHAPYLPDLSFLSLDDHTHEFGIYQEQQFRFVESLNKTIQSKITVRLHDRWINTLWSDDRRWNDRIPSIPLDNGNVSMQSLIVKSRLVVYSYDSSGILESLASNIPTMCFWNGGLNHLLPIAKPYYELLRGAGILADSPEHAAQLVSRHWDNLDEWWSSKQVQNAREIFCDRYARVEKHPVKTMKRLLMDALESTEDIREVG